MFVLCICTQAGVGDVHVGVSNTPRTISLDTEGWAGDLHPGNQSVGQGVHHYGVVLDVILSVGVRTFTHFNKDWMIEWQCSKNARFINDLLMIFSHFEIFFQFEIFSIILNPSWHDRADFRRVNHLVADILEVSVDVRPKLPTLWSVFAGRASGKPAHQEDSVHVVNTGIVCSRVTDLIW